MSSAITFLLPLLLAVTAPPGLFPVVASLETSPRGIQLGDPVFAKVTICNWGSEPVEIPLGFIWGSTLFFYIDNSASEYTYEARQGYGGGGVAPGILPPRKPCVVAYEIIELPPADHFSRDFWSEIAALGGGAIRAHLRHKLIDPMKGASAGVHIKRRPDGEMKQLSRLYAESTRRREQARLPDDFDYTRPQPGYFGLSSLSLDEDTVHGLLSMEDDLSPGTLRDIVHLTKMMRAIYDGKEEPKRMETVRDLLGWLDSLPEIERHCLAIEILKWCGSSSPYEPVFFELADGVIDRLPERAFQKDDYRKYWRSQLMGDRPPFAEYLKQRAKSGSK